MRSAVLVLSWNAAEAALNCLTALAAQHHAPQLTMVVDNGSSDGTADQIAARFPEVLLLRNQHNLGFAGGMNAGLAALCDLPEPPELVVLLNQDTQVDPGWLEALITPFAADPNLGALGCKIRYPDGTLQHAGVILNRTRAIVGHVGWHEEDTGQYDTPRDCEFVTGAAIALRMSALARVGWFDEGYAPAYFEDLDLCWRLRVAGYRISYQPRATLVHHESLSVRDEVTRSAYYNRGRMRFVLKSYTPDELAGPFLDAELDFMHRHLWVDEGRVLRWAYAETLASLSDIVAARRRVEPDLPAAAADLMRDLLLRLHRGRTEALRRNAAERADWMFSH